MTTRSGRDQGLSTVRRTTIWISGGAVLTVGAFAALFGQPQASAKAAPASTGGTFDGAQAPTTTRPPTPSTTRPSSGSSGSATTALRSTTTTPPTTQAPRTTRRRPSVSSGGS